MRGTPPRSIITPEIRAAAVAIEREVSVSARMRGIPFTADERLRRAQGHESGKTIDLLLYRAACARLGLQPDLRFQGAS